MDIDENVSWTSDRWVDLGENERVGAANFNGEQ